ncbi:hypothetical protein JCM15831A_10080 [Asaia astilbis]
MKRRHAQAAFDPWFGQRLCRNLESVQTGTNVSCKVTTHFRELKAPRLSNEKFVAQSILKQSNLLADCRRCDIKFGRTTCKTAVPRRHFKSHKERY